MTSNRQRRVFDGTFLLLRPICLMGKLCERGTGHVAALSLACTGQPARLLFLRNVSLAAPHPKIRRLCAAGTIEARELGFKINRRQRPEEPRDQSWPGQK
jgi:hypothetical protein